MCFSLAELLIPEKGFVLLCVPVSVRVCGFYMRLWLGGAGRMLL